MHTIKRRRRRRRRMRAKACSGLSLAARKETCAYMFSREIRKIKASKCFYSTAVDTALTCMRGGLPLGSFGIAMKLQATMTDVSTTCKTSCCLDLMCACVALCLCPVAPFCPYVSDPVHCALGIVIMLPYHNHRHSHHLWQIEDVLPSRIRCVSITM